MKYIATIQEAIELIGDHHIIAFDFTDIEQIRDFLCGAAESYGTCEVLDNLVVQVDVYNGIYQQLRDGAGEL